MAALNELPERDIASQREVVSLVRRASTGDRAAFGELYQQHVRMVHGILLANSDEDDVRDLVHDVFVSALEKLHTLKEPAAFGSWVATIARNTARMERRNRLKLVPLDESIPAAAPATLDGPQVLAAIRSLPDAYRETLLLRLVEDMSGAEIAERTGLALGSVRVNLHRGMAILRERLRGAR